MALYNNETRNIGGREYTIFDNINDLIDYSSVAADLEGEYYIFRNLDFRKLKDLYTKIKIENCFLEKCIIDFSLGADQRYTDTHFEDCKFYGNTDTDVNPLYLKTCYFQKCEFEDFAVPWGELTTIVFNDCLLNKINFCNTMFETINFMDSKLYSCGFNFCAVDKDLFFIDTDLIRCLLDGKIEPSDEGKKSPIVHFNGEINITETLLLNLPFWAVSIDKDVSFIYDPYVKNTLPTRSQKIEENITKIIEESRANRRNNITELYNKPEKKTPVYDINAYLFSSFSV